MLQQRDGYFSRLKSACELQHELNGERVAIISHSMGGITTFNFLQWVNDQVRARPQRRPAHARR